MFPDIIQLCEPGTFSENTALHTLSKISILLSLLIL